MNKYKIPFNREVQSIVLEKRFNATTAKRLKSDCTFKIDTEQLGRNAGIYVNILKMRLRQVKLTGICIDSITVKYNDDVKKRFCGDQAPGVIKSIEDMKGKVKITVSIDTGKPLRDDEILEFQIVATAFKGLLHKTAMISFKLISFLNFQIAMISILSLTAEIT